MSEIEKGGDRNSPDTAELGTVQCPVENLQREPPKSISVLSAWPVGVCGAHGTPAGQGASWQHSTALRDAGPSTGNAQETKPAAGTARVQP